MDAELLRAARAGEREALEKLCDTLYPELRRFFAGLLRGAEGADDLAQETLLRLLRALPDYRSFPGARFEGWVFRIAYRLFLDEKRRVPSLPLEDFEPPDPRAGPEEAYARGERALLVRRAVAALPDDERAMVTMRYGLEMGYADIARALGVDVVRVKWKLHEALRRMKAEFGKEERV